MLNKLIKKVFGDPIQRQLKVYAPQVEKINAFEASMQPLSDAALKAKTMEFKERLENGAELDSLLPEAFATVREAAKRVLNMRHFDVQLIGGIVLHQGNIAEMKTGEGKTLMATLPVYLNALSGKGVYMVTVNDYLAKRDSEWMGEVYEFLGMSVGLIQSGMSPEDRIKAYAADITFGTNNEYGFDYLRDNLSYSSEEICQKRQHYAIVDEVDSILIDEARTPLIISGPIQDSTSNYRKVVKVAKALKRDTHFTVDEKHKNVVITDDGVTEIETTLNISNMYSMENMDIAHIANQCLKAIHLFQKDVDYVVKDNQVMIVDEFTGRLMDGRRYSDGLHQAIEAVESVTIQDESQTLAAVTFQNYFRMFDKLAGMTGTAVTEEAEFGNIYGLGVVQVPTNKPITRDDRSDVVYKSKAEKYKAIIQEVKAANEKGAPVLVGTISIDTSEYLSTLLKKEKIGHRVLNAKYHEQEAEIITNAGQKGMVTIATNMAGRGTDIVLGDGVQDLGGLYVIGSERHESRRIDNQLRGRAGRQGDPGASRFFVSLEDDLMRLFGSDRIATVMGRLGLPDDTPIEHGMVTSSIERAQKKVEKYHYGIRKQVLQYDDVMNKQREAIYGLRRQLLEKRDLDTKIQELIAIVVQSLVSEFYRDQPIHEHAENHADFEKRFQSIFPIGNINVILTQKQSREDYLTQISKVAWQFFQKRREGIDEVIFNEIVIKQIFLMTLDRKWIDHLHDMEVLREGIGLRSIGQKDPLIEYKMEAFDMYTTLIFNVAEEAFSLISRAVIVDENQKPIHSPVGELEYNTAAEKKEIKPAQSDDKIGRNEKVTLNKEGRQKEVKWKKAQELINEGWVLNS